MFKTLRYTSLVMKALIFDFDGLILETEMPDYQSWQEVYRQHGVELPLEKWASIVGGNAESEFDPNVYLEELTGKPVDRDAIWIQRRKKYMEILEAQPILPGVLELIEQARQQGFKLGVASSSPESWVHGHLTRLGLMETFDCICTADDVENIKPDPSLFLQAARNLGVDPQEAIVFEDSPNGVLAANRAGMFVVAVPNPLTKQLALDHADLILDSLAEVTLQDLIEKSSK